MLALALGTCAPAVRADTLRATGEGALSEISHSVEVFVADGIATYKVRRVFVNRGARADEADLEIVLLHGAAATGLRVRAGGRWHEAKLSESEPAAKRYAHRSGSPARNDRSVMLSWISRSQLWLRLYPVLPDQTTTVEYTLTAPTRYQHGYVILAYPRAQPVVDENAGSDWARPPSLPLAIPVMHLHASWGSADTEVRVDEEAAALGVPIVLHEQDPEPPPAVENWGDEQEIEWGLDAAIVRIKAPRADVAAVHLGEAIASQETAVVRLAIQMSPQMAPMPRRTQVLFVVDASHSQRAQGMAAQLHLIASYLSHVPDAEVAVVVYRRTAAPLFRGFVPAAQVAKHLTDASASGALNLGNGSALDAGIKLASRLLKTRKGPLRMILTSDSLLRPSFSRHDALGSLSQLPERAVVHVVEPYLADEQDTLQRDDQHVLSPLAAAHHGIFADVSLAPAGRAVLGLIRPVQLDSVVVLGLSRHVQTDFEQLREGEGLLITDHVQTAPGALVVRGKLWADPWQRVLRPGQRFSRATAAWVFSEDKWGALSDTELLRLAQLSRSVSPATSYLVASPGNRPEPLEAPYDESASDDMGGGYRGYGKGPMGPPHVVPDLMALVRAKAVECEVGAQTQADWSLQLEVDTTLDEIVDVAVARSNAPAPLVSCLVELVWAVRLDARFRLEHEHFSLAFGAAFRPQSSRPGR